MGYGVDDDDISESDDTEKILNPDEDYDSTPELIEVDNEQQFYCRRVASIRFNEFSSNCLHLINFLYCIFFI